MSSIDSMHRAGAYPLAQTGDNAAITYDFEPDRTKGHYVKGVDFSFSADPAAGTKLTISVTDPKGNWIPARVYYIKSGGPGPLMPSIQTTKGQGLRITLDASGTGGVLAALNIHGYEQV